MDFETEWPDFATKKSDFETDLIHLPPERTDFATE
jgi:hypothetical protein